MITLSTHVLDADAGLALVGVRVTVTDQVGEVVGWELPVPMGGSQHLPPAWRPAAIASTGRRVVTSCVPWPPRSS